jgi:hypothetical protein
MDVEEKIVVSARAGFATFPARVRAITGVAPA